MGHDRSLSRFSYVQTSMILEDLFFSLHSFILMRMDLPRREYRLVFMSIQTVTRLAVLHCMFTKRHRLISQKVFSLAICLLFSL